jgi:ribosomal protein L37AE/L43A
MLNWEIEMSAFGIRCPKCGSHAVERGNNQEYTCRKCGKVFYFVTPDTGSQLDLSRYEL